MTRWQVWLTTTETEADCKHVSVHPSAEIAAQEFCRDRKIDEDCRVTVKRYLDDYELVYRVRAQPVVTVEYTATFSNRVGVLNGYKQTT